MDIDRPPTGKEFRDTLEATVFRTIGLDDVCAIRLVGGKLTAEPSDMPSSTPSQSPSDEPSDIPSDSPSDQPTETPSISPEPSSQPSSLPSLSPSSSPTSCVADSACQEGRNVCSKALGLGLCAGEGSCNSKNACKGASDADVEDGSCIGKLNLTSLSASLVNLAASSCFFRLLRRIGMSRLRRYSG